LGSDRSGWHRLAGQPVLVVYRGRFAAHKKRATGRHETGDCGTYPYYSEKTGIMEKKSIILGAVRLLLVGLWGPVAVEKLWDLQGFHSTLLRQPIPEWSTDILFWLLPLAELGAAALI